MFGEKELLYGNQKPYDIDSVRFDKIDIFDEAKRSSNLDNWDKLKYIKLIQNPAHIKIKKYFEI